MTVEIPTSVLNLSTAKLHTSHVVFLKLRGGVLGGGGGLSYQVTSKVPSSLPSGTPEIFELLEMHLKLQTM